MNRPLTPSLSPSEGGEGARRAGEGDGSWSQCVRKSDRRLPMNPEQHRTPNAEMSKDSRCHSMFGVGCSMFSLGSGVSTRELFISRKSLSARASQGEG